MTRSANALHVQDLKALHFQGFSRYVNFAFDGSIVGDSQLEIYAWTRASMTYVIGIIGQFLFAPSPTNARTRALTRGLSCAARQPAKRTSASGTGSNPSATRNQAPRMAAYAGGLNGR